MIGGIKLIIVDGDDTIWYDRRYFARLYNRVRQALGDAKSLYLNSALRASSKGEAGFVNAIREYIRLLHLWDEGEIESAIAEFVGHPLEFLPSAEDALLALRDVAPLLLYTSGIEAEQERKIARSGIGDIFSLSVIVESKTETSLQKIIDDVGVPPSAAIIIGDSVKYDVLPARDVGVNAVWLNHEENKHGRDAAGPKDILEVISWTELMRLWHLKS